VTRRWNDRLGLLNWRSSLVTAALAGMVVMSAIGAWQARLSWLDHQRAVETTLDEYAAFAARSFYLTQFNENMLVREQALASVTGASAHAGDVLTLERFATVALRALDPGGDISADSLRGFFRLDIRNGALQAMGAAVQPERAARIRSMLSKALEGIDTLRIVSTVLPDPRKNEATVMYAVQRNAAGTAVAIYGVIFSWRRSFGVMIQKVLPRTVLLPPSVLAAMSGSGAMLRPDTLVSIRVTERDGTVYYQSPRQFTSDAHGVYGATSPMRLDLWLHPMLVEQLRASMLDESRKRLQLALPIVAVLFAIIAILHFRRERELVRARRDFVASVSHELRTPLAQIRMFSETLLLRREDSEEERMHWLGIIGREARRLGDLVENILLFSHIDAARVRLEPERTDVGELVEEVVEAYVPIAASRRMRIVADAPSRIFAIVDPRALRQIVVNLVDNALKYGPAGQTVTVEVERDTTVARLAVSDEGPGVPAADRRRLWQPFVRLANAGSTIGGSGIGLSVVRSLVRQHGGSVEVEDAEGKGACFVVTIPLAGDGNGARMRNSANGADAP
jgi:signal transduction histidine kinase